MHIKDDLILELLVFAQDFEALGLIGNTDV